VLTNHEQLLRFSWQRKGFKDMPFVVNKVGATNPDLFMTSHQFTCPSQSATYSAISARTGVQYF
jgi:hypothetical protein